MLHNLFDADLAIILATQNASLDKVLQFPNIARPVVAFKMFDNFPAEAGYWPGVFFRILPDEMVA